MNTKVSLDHPPSLRSQNSRHRIGDRLLSRGWVTPQQVEQALEAQRRGGGFLGETFLDMGVITTEQLGAVLEEMYLVPYVDLSTALVDPEAIAVVPERFAREKQLLPLRFEQGQLVTAMVDPLDLSATDELRLLAGRRVVPVVTTERALQRALNEHFNPLSKAQDALAELRVETAAAGVEGTADDERAVKVSDAPIVRLANSILDSAVAAEASDVHLEPQENGLRVRLRVDGRLREHMLVPRAQQAAVVSRIKIMAGMDIAETRRPQDGRAILRDGAHGLDLRVASMRTVHGEKVVLRILNQHAIDVPLERLGFLPEQLRLYQSLVKRPYGIILVTGPTGSGKSTTLYATLSQINQPDLNITTIEDPVEYQLRGINQTQVNVRAGITFASGLRALLRQDPDIILVGEIRDRETAEIAVQASLTGHLVLSTLHTNTATGAITRLANMGAEPFLIASAVVGVVAQRLVRRICSSCEESVQPSPELLVRLGLDPQQYASILFKRGRGCRECNESGYRGRIAVHEVLKTTEELRRLIIRRESAEEMSDLCVREGMQPLANCAVQKVLQGLTTPEEVIRIVQSAEGEAAQY